MMLPFGMILLIYGIIKALFGYKLYRIALFFAGFLVGAVVGGVIGAAASGTAVAIIAGLLLGILLGFLNVILMKLGIFVQCFAYGFMGAMIPAVMKLMDGQVLIQGAYNYLVSGNAGFDDPRDMLPVALIAGVILGIIGVILSRIIIILTTGLFGGMMSGLGLCILLGNFDTGFLLVTALAVAVLGIIVQLRTTGKQNAVQKKTIQTVERTEQSAPGIDQSIPGKEKSASKVDFGKQAAAAQLYASKALLSFRENGGKAAEAVKRTGKTGFADLRNRQKSMEETVCSRNMGFSMEELLTQIEVCLYRNRVMAWIFPFLEGLTVAVVLLFMISGGMYAVLNPINHASTFATFFYGLFWGLERGKLIFFLAAFLGMVKRNSVMVFSVLGMESIMGLIAGLMEPVSFLYRIWEIALYIVLIIWYYRIFAQRSNSSFKNNTVVGRSTVFSTESAKYSTRKVCPQCGADISSKMKFCSKCGKTLI